MTALIQQFVLNAKQITMFHQIIVNHAAQTKLKLNVKTV